MNKPPIRPPDSKLVASGPPYSKLKCLYASAQWSTKELGAVYTPDVLGDWVAETLIRNLRSDIFPAVLDPSCGDGALLKSVQRQLGRNVELFGLDINDRAVTMAKAKLGENSEILRADALTFLNKDLHTPLNEQQYWNVHGIIANPPWGAELPASTQDLRNRGYTLARGQFDSYDLFVELALTRAPIGTILAFILPDSLFLTEHVELRRLLVSNSELLLIARLGEGFFDAVNRGICVLVTRKGPPLVDHKVQCIRLTPEWRSNVLSGTATLGEAEAKLSHYVPQSRFQLDTENRFDIDIHERERHVITQIEETARQWSRWFESGRGVELSKGGWIATCKRCGWSTPYPRTVKYLTCAACHSTSATGEWDKSSIVRSVSSHASDWIPFVVGEDVDRYRSKVKRELQLNRAGINYKTTDIYNRRRLLIRKTGVGIKACILAPGAYTNQVVFHYYLKDRDSPEWLLDYVLGVLCSRILLAYHLKRIGENEWRSHPYVTQNVIARFPIPDPELDSKQWMQAKAIAQAASVCAKNGAREVHQDIYVEQLVAGLFNFDQLQMDWALSVINAGQDLEAISSLKLLEGSISPIKVY